MIDTDSVDGVHDDDPAAMPAASGQETVITFVLSGPIPVAVLERVVSDAQAQLQSLAAAGAGAMSSGARIEVPHPMASERVAQAGAVSSVGPPRAAGGSACVAVAACALDAPPSDRIPLAVVPSREPGPVPRAVEPKARGLRRMISVLKHDHYMHEPTAPAHVDAGPWAIDREIVAIKFVVTGPFAAGKTTLVRTMSEIPVVGTESAVTDDTSAIKTNTTVGMDFGKLTLVDEGMDGYLVLLDLSRPETFCACAGHARCASWPRP